MRLNYLYLSILLFLMAPLFPGQKLSAQDSESIPESERQVLIDIYNSTHGENWAEDYRWNLKKTPNDWIGVLIEGGHVRGLALGKMGLQGTLPPSLFTGLPYLIALDVSSNRLSGEIPEGINKLKNLEALFLGSNLWSGKLPSLDQLTQLKYLDLSNLLVINSQGDIVTMVDATLPDLSIYKNLESFDGSFSAFKGEISKNIGHCKKLRSLDLTGNLLTGPLPESLNECYDLRILSVQLNRLSGEIPNLSDLRSLGQVGPDEFGRLYLNDNRFTGEFPQWVTSLSHLTRFSCANNKLSGKLPSDLSDMSSLQAFFADHNQFEGNLPEKLPNTLEELDLSDNKLQGTLPQSWSKAKALGMVLLQNNELSGIVPPLFKTLKNLDGIVVSKNCFSLKDWKDWKTFASQSDVKFVFGRQKPYSENQRIDLRSGETLQLDASYPKELIGDEVYEWYNLTQMKKVDGQKSAQLQLTDISEKEACRYACIIRSPQLKVSEKSETATPQKEAADDWNYEETQPSLVSGFFDVYVDGNTTIGVADPLFSKEIWAYPSILKKGEPLRINRPEKIHQMILFDTLGNPIREFNNLLDMTPLDEIPSGNYFLKAIFSNGGSDTLLLIIEK